ncbi:MAG: sensor domain-containing diguanylate cyclase [Thermodesulfobacteriota bacterium]
MSDMESGGLFLPDNIDELKAQYLALLKANNCLNERVLELYTLYNVSRTLSASLQVSDLFELVVGLIGESLNVDQYCLMLLDKELQKLQIRASHGMPEDILNRGEVKVTEGVSGRVVSSGQPLVIDDISAEKDFFYFPNSGIHQGSYLGLPLKNVNGAIMGVLNVHKPIVNGFSQTDLRLFAAVAEHVAIAINNAMTFQQTQELIRRDELTGLFNRRYFFERFEREIYRSRRYGRFISLLMIDIDHFKEYNDNYGHLRGDRVLKHVSQILECSLRQVDVVARYGGEEFLVLLPETPKEKAAIVGEKLRKAVEAIDFNEDAPHLGPCTLTVTVGVAGIPDDASATLDALDIADKALYLGKARGRNQVCTTVLAEMIE